MSKEGKGSEGEAKVLKAFLLLGFRVPTTCGGKGKGRIKGSKGGAKGAKGANRGQRGVNRGHFYTRFLGSPPPGGGGQAKGAKGANRE